MTINGHGIGLALTQRIILLHRGQLTVESVVDRGTTFRVTLPVVRTQFVVPPPIRSESGASHQATG